MHRFQTPRSRLLGQAPLLLAFAGVVGCSSAEGGGRLRVGEEPSGDSGSGGGSGNGPGRADGGLEGGDAALGVHVEDADALAIEVVTLACSGDCADIHAVAHGGNPPYALEWEDGSTTAARRVCLDASTTLRVTATDTAIDDSEFHYEARTAQAEVSALVLDCSDAGAPTDGGTSGESVYWTTWTAMTIGKPGSGQGVLSPPGGDVTVSYTGEAADGSAITGQPSVSGIATVTFAPQSTYQSATVGNGPPESGMIGVFGDATLTQTVTFSVPVRDPLIAVVTLGNFGMGTSWTFDDAVEVLSSGPGVFNQNGTLSASGAVLTGTEGNGVVQLSGSFTALSFTVPSGTDFAAFTVGIRGRD